MIHNFKLITKAQVRPIRNIFNSTRKTDTPSNLAWLIFGWRLDSITEGSFATSCLFICIYACPWVSFSFIFILNGTKWYQIYHIKIILATIRRSAQRVCWVDRRVIAPAGNTHAPFEEMKQQWRVDGTVYDLAIPKFKPQTSRFTDNVWTSRSSSSNALPLDQMTR